MSIIQLTVSVPKNIEKELVIELEQKLNKAIEETTQQFIKDKKLDKYGIISQDKIDKVLEELGNREAIKDFLDFLKSQI